MFLLTNNFIIHVWIVPNVENVKNKKMKNTSCFTIDITCITIG